MIDKPWNIKLKSRRALMEMTQAEAAEELGVSRKTYNEWELAKRKPTEGQQQDIAGLFQVDSEDIFG